MARVLGVVVREVSILGGLAGVAVASMGFAGFVAESKIPGAVPFLRGLIKPYDGEVMSPFMRNMFTTLRDTSVDTAWW